MVLLLGNCRQIFKSRRVENLCIWMMQVIYEIYLRHPEIDLKNSVVIVPVNIAFA